MDDERHTILVVDDTPIDAGIIVGALKNQFRTAVATDGERALAIASADSKPDLILLDVMMSGIDGYEVCRRLKAGRETRNIPIIFLTAKTEVEDEKRGFDLGAVDYIHKPFSPPIVLARVRTHLALEAALRNAHASAQRLSDANKVLEERVAAALEREQARQAELARVTRITTMGAFTASIAHEINQPLAGILANSGAAARWLSSAEPNLAEARAALQRIGDDANRAGQVLSGLRAMFTKDDGKRSLLSLNVVIKDALKLVQGVIQKHQVSFKGELSQDALQVVADSTQLQQLFINLILNAIEAMVPITDRDRMLAIKLEIREHQRILVSVEDSGIGIDEGDAERIFDTLFTTKAGGMGMGLSICRSIVEGHGGRLWASRRVPYGSVFYVELPRSV
jgi:C4-dicarboxylate-specific signal transduction histidine kinase